MRSLVCIVVVLGLVAGTLSATDTTKPRKKKAPAAAVMQSPSTSHATTQAAESGDPRVGVTKGGKVVYRGKKGGYYVITPQGRKRYVKEADIIFDNK
ncbi:MAG: hypothetical protein RML15_07695 [Bacteroidota bacterium]|nr:hypothetical protein [Candidatus Kapabacteria bacterium]MDW8075673.1 hypothetical protein [Bacteroidota bacterium]MDW8272270.1 hypothetical protein [Bacteroidota bacterium]